MLTPAVNRIGTIEARCTIKSAPNARIRHFAGFLAVRPWNGFFSHGWGITRGMYLVQA